MVPAIVLTEENAAAHGLAGVGPFTFGGAFPGDYAIDQPVEVSYLGFASAEEAQRTVERKTCVTSLINASLPEGCMSARVWRAEEAQQALEAAFADPDFQPLELVEVELGEGKPIRINHAPSAEEARAEQVDEAVEEVAGGKITTHAEADAVAAELGFKFPDDPRPKVDDKVAAIEAIRAGGTPEIAIPLTEEETEEAQA